MADFRKLIPFILKWAAGVSPRSGETVEALFERARTRGWSDHPLDRGGATMCDVTLQTYRDYCSRKRLPVPDKEALRHIPFAHWVDILKSAYWNRWKADKINNQSMANLLVDWVLASGCQSIKRAQRVIGVNPDGIAGRATLAAINSQDAKLLFSRLHDARIDYVQEIVRRNPEQQIWLNGWLNRINDIRFQSDGTDHQPNPTGREKN